MATLLQKCDSSSCVRVDASVFQFAFIEGKFMRNVTVKTVLFGVVVGLMLTACGKKKELVEPTSPSYTRHWKQNIGYGTTEAAIATTYNSFVAGCIQLVDYKNVKTAKVDFTQLEFSSEVCPSDNGLAEAVSIRAKFLTKADNTRTIFFNTDETNFGAYETVTNPFDNSQSVELSELCTGEFNGNCTVTVEASKLKSIQ